jgi:hypothetical protein
MPTEEFFQKIQGIETVSDLEDALSSFLASHKDEWKWTPVGGKENNRGIIDVATDPGRSLVERITNAIDAVLEDEHDKHHGFPKCGSPREASSAWLGIPDGGLSEMSPKVRRDLAQRVVVRISAGDDRKESRIVETRDFGIGIAPEAMPHTILSLNESNKWKKHYLAGTYGQGGSSTFAISKYTFIASRCGSHATVGFTIVRYEDLPAEMFKTGHYVYLTLNGSVLQAEVSQEYFPTGTLVKHFGYDLNSYSSPLGPNSVYGLLNEVLFDPIMPVWLDNRVHDYRRVIKGSRNALNGAVDEGDEEKRGPKLSHNTKLFYVSIGEFGQIGVEYWVLEKPTKENKRPSAAFVNSAKPIVLTLNGQTHEEMTSHIVRKDAELPYLAQRLIFHVDCNPLTADGKRLLFSSTREGARRGLLYDLIQKEIVRILRSDDELARLNEEARREGMREMDESAALQMRQEVARLLRIHGLDISETIGGVVSGDQKERGRPTHPRGPRPELQPIELHDPPTFLKIVWEKEKEIPFYPEQRRYVRIETDADSRYHSPNNPEKSRINVIITGDDLVLRGSTPLQGGRMRIILQGNVDARIAATGNIRVELTRSNLPTLSDERKFRIVEMPPIRSGERRVTIPPFDVRPVDGPDDSRWTALGWPDSTSLVASSAQMEHGTLVIYYSTVFPKFSSQRAAFEGKDVAAANSFTERYKIWLAVHSLLLHQDQVSNESKQVSEEAQLTEETREREERCRIANLSCLFAAREAAQLSPPREQA